MEFFFGGTKIEARFQHNKGFDPVKMCGSNVFHDYGENSEALMKSFGEVAEFTKRKDDRDVFTKNFENDTEPEPEVSCCGDYPHRREYTVGGHKECCESAATLFSPLRHECCLDGTIRDIGSCGA